MAKVEAFLLNYRRMAIPVSPKPPAKNLIFGMAAGLLALSLTGCGQGQGCSGPPATAIEAAAAQEPSMAEYRLGSGDKIRVRTYGVEQMSGEFEVDFAGSIDFPLIGPVQGGRTHRRRPQKADHRLVAPRQAPRGPTSLGRTRRRSPFLRIG